MNKHLLSPIAGAIALFGFFSPWMSCGMMTFSGIELASGSGASGMGDLGGAANSGSGAEPILFAIPAAALLIIGIYFFFKKGARLASAMLPTMIVAVLALFVMTLKYIDVQDMKSEVAAEGATTQATDVNFGAAMGDMISVKWGFWLTAIAFITAAYGATQYRDLPKRPEDITHPGTPMEAPPGEVVSSEPPPDASMTEDKGMG